MKHVNAVKLLRAWGAEVTQVTQAAQYYQSQWIATLNGQTLGWCVSERGHVCNRIRSVVVGEKTLIRINTMPAHFIQRALAKQCHRQWGWLVYGPVALFKLKPVLVLIITPHVRGQEKIIRDPEALALAEAWKEDEEDTLLGVLEDWLKERSYLT